MHQMIFLLQEHSMGKHVWKLSWEKVLLHKTQHKTILHSSYKITFLKKDWVDWDQKNHMISSTQTVKHIDTIMIWQL